MVGWLSYAEAGHTLCTNITLLYKQLEHLDDDIHWVSRNAFPLDTKGQLWRSFHKVRTFDYNSLYGQMVTEIPFLHELSLYIHPPDKGENSRTFPPKAPLALLPWVNKPRERSQEEGQPKPKAFLGQLPGTHDPKLLQNRTAYIETQRSKDRHERRCLTQGHSESHIQTGIRKR